MKKTGFLFASALLALFSAGITACSDNEPDGGKGGDTAYDEPVDELQYLQSSIVRVDDNGEIVERLLGEPLDAAAPDELTVGVDSFDEARELFRSLFADTTKVSDDGTMAEFSIKKGTATLMQSNGNDGRVATAVFDVPGLQHVSKLHFILHSAWPENAGGKGFHKLGVLYEYKAWTGNPTPAATDRFDPNAMYQFMCIREYKDGVPALLMGISPNDYYIYWRYSSEYSGNIPGKKRAQDMSAIVRANWDFFEKSYNAGGNSRLHKGWQYWIDSGKDYGFAVYRDAIDLSTGKVERYDVHWKEPKRAVLFFVESGLKQ